MAAPSIRVDAYRWYRVPAPEHIPSHEETSTAQQVYQAVSAERQSQSEQSPRKFNFIDLTSTFSVQRENLYQIAYGLILNGQYTQAIEILKNMMRYSAETHIVQLFTFALVECGTHFKSIYHLKSAHTFATSMLQKTDLSDEVRIEFIVYAANSFIELTSIMSRTFMKPMFNTLDAALQLKVTDERKANAALSIGLVQISVREFQQAIAIFTAAFDLKSLGPSTRARLLYNLALTHFTIGNIDHAFQTMSLGLIIAEISCPELLENYRSLDSFFKQNLPPTKAK